MSTEADKCGGPGGTPGPCPGPRKPSGSGGKKPPRKPGKKPPAKPRKPPKKPAAGDAEKPVKKPPKKKPPKKPAGKIKPPKTFAQLAKLEKRKAELDLEIAEFDKQIKSSKGRIAALKKAQKEGFKPTSKDPWINEQQAIEHLEPKLAKRVATKAKQAKIKSKSPNERIHQQETINHLYEKGLVSRKEKTSVQIKLSRALEIGGAALPPAVRRKALNILKKEKISALWEDARGSAAAALKFSATKFPEAPKSKLISSSKKIISKLYSAEAFLSRYL